MGLPTKTNPLEDDASPPYRLWDTFVSIMEWTMAIVAIMACGMLFSAAFIPDKSELANSTSPVVLPDWEGPTIEPKKQSTIIPERNDLPEIVDTSNWRDSSPNREQLFMKELDALNFKRPIHKSADFRLSGADVPSLYEVHLNVKIRGREKEPISQFEGKSRTHFSRVGAASNTVELSVFGLYIDTVSLSCNGSNPRNGKHHRDDRKQSLIVTMEEEIATGSNCVMELTWTGQAYADNTGLYETWFALENDTLSYSLATHGETMHTRKWMPCFDEPKYKVPLKLSIEHPSGSAALSNAPVASIKESGGRLLTSFSETWPISTYLYAFSVTSDYVSNATMVDGLPVSVYVPAPLSFHLPRLMKEVATIIPPSLKTFNAVHLNKKIDFVFFPDHTSAMENPGHISLGWEFLNRTDTLVHEMMHQYFGNLITLEWWTDLWINEGFANYYEEIVMTGKNSELHLTNLRFMSDNSMSSDVYETSVPLHVEVNTFIESRYQFRLPYSKGGIIINMLRDYLGQKEFDGIIEKLLNERTNSTLSLQQFLESLRETGGDRGDNAAEIARDFLGQAGYPLLVVRQFEGYTLIRQVRAHRGFVEERQRDFDTRWTIPVHLTAIDGSYSKTIVMKRDVPEITLNHSGILIVDPKKVVYYRVIYDKQTYNSIHKSKLSEEDKNWIESDLIVAANFGYTDISATYYTIMRRGSVNILQMANERLMSLFPVNHEKAEQAKKLLERLSGHKVTKRHNHAAVYEHTLRHRRCQSGSGDDDDELIEELSRERDRSDCPIILNDPQKGKELRKYSSIPSNRDVNRRNTSSLNCILRTATEKEMKSWIAKLFDNHDSTFHFGDLLEIFRLIRVKTNDSFVQDFIVDELPKNTNYYKVAVLFALQRFESKHLDQLKRLIAKQPEAAAENWIDIANIFERAHASRSEAEILGPRVIKALKKLSGEKEDDD